MISMGKHSYNATGDIDCYSEVNLTIGKFCSIGSGLKILSGTHPCIAFPEVVSQYPFKEQWHVDYPPSTGDGFVTIKNDVWIATDVRILEGVTIGDGAIVAACSVVTKDVKPYSIVAGNPAIHKRYRFAYEGIQKLLRIAWWDLDDDRIREMMPYMKNIEEFLNMYDE